MIVSVIVLALVASLSAITSADAVPCAVLGQGDLCPNPITEGVVDGQWIALLFHYDGTNGGPTSIAVFSVGIGGNGAASAVIQEIKPEGEYGDKMEAQFVDGKLWVKNAVYLPGEGHCCPTHITVRQFGFHGKKLEWEAMASVPYAASESQIRTALRNGPHMY